jgi:hypothetical protein
MVITIFAIIGAFCVTLIGVILFTALSRLFIALFIDIVILRRYSFFHFLIAHKATSDTSRNREYKFHPVHYIIYSFQFLNTPVCFLCDWLHKLRFINYQCNKENKEAREKSPIDISPLATAHTGNLSRGSTKCKQNQRDKGVDKYYILW